MSSLERLKVVCAVLLTSTLLTGTVLFSRGIAWAAEPVDYASQVAPIFKKYCIGCHNADKAKGELDLQSYKAAFAGGESGVVIVPGKSAESLLLRLVKREEKPFMPPGKRPRPSAEEVAILQAWIDAGAPGPKAGETETRTIETPHVEVTVVPRRPITALAYSPVGDTVALGRYGEVDLYSVARRKVVRTLDELSGKVMAVAYTADGTHLVTGGGEPGLSGGAQLWKIADGSKVQSYEGHKDNVFAIALSPDGQILATGSYDGEVRLWNVESGAEMTQLAGHHGPVFDLAFRADGRILGSASDDRTVKLWDVETGQRVDTFAEATKAVYALAFTPDGRRLAAAGVESRVRVWQISDTGKEGTNVLLHSRFGHEGPIIRLEYSPDGRTLLSAAEDRTVKLWEADTIKERFLLRVQPDWATASGFSADSRRVAIGCLDGTVAFFDVENGYPLRLSDASPPRSKRRRDQNETELVRSGTFVGRSLLIGALGILAAVLDETGLDETVAKPDAPAKTAKPELARLEPRGVQRGVKTRIKAVGAHLGGITEIRFHHPKLTGNVVTEDESAKNTETEVWIEVLPAADLPVDSYEISLVTEGGESDRRKLHVGDLPHVYDLEPRNLKEVNESVGIAAGVWGVSVWGVLNKKGDQDLFKLSGTSGDTLVLDGEARRLGSKANLLLSLLDDHGRVLASNNDFEAGGDPLLAYTLSETGVYTVRVRDLTLEGSGDHYYRLSLGTFPFVTACYPLSVPAGQESQVELVGYNITPGASVKIEAEAPGERSVEIDAQRFRSRGAIKVLVDGVLADGALVDGPLDVREQEPNNQVEQATRVRLPAVAHGRIWNDSTSPEVDSDLFRFDARAGQVLTLETEAARRGSPIDTRIEVLDARGQPVPQVVLQAVRDSVINFRPIDSKSGGARLDYWEEMEINQFLYINGEVCRLFRKPRGPDSTWDFYSSGGRRNYFGTSATAHPLHQPCYIVEPHRPGTRLVPNGLPVFRIDYSNDDDSERKLGKDSRLLFAVPTSGEYLARVTNVAGEDGPRQLYRLHIREARPGFEVTLDNRSPSVPRGGGVSFAVRAARLDGFEGTIRIDIDDAPPGITVSTPMVIQAGHTEAKGSLYVDPAAPQPNAEIVSKVKFIATATINGEEIREDVAAFEKITITKEPAFFVSLEDFVPDAERMKNSEWRPLKPTGYLSGGGATLSVKDDGSLLASGVRPLTDTYTITINTKMDLMQGLRLIILKDDSLPEKGPGRGENGRFTLTGLQVRAAPLGDPASSRILELKNPRSSVTDDNWPIEHVLDGKADTGWSIPKTSDQKIGEPSTATFDFAELLSHPLGTTLTVTLEQHAGEHNTLGRFQLVVNGVPAIRRPSKPFELTVAPGETISAMLRVERNGHEGRIRFNVDNLPHGVIVDNIGLSGVLVRPGEVEREIFLKCDSWVPETSRLCYVISTEPAGQTSLPVLLKVKRREGVAAKP